MTAVEFRVLGPFEVRRAGSLLADGGGRRQALLSVLLLSANRTVSTEHLVTGVWGADHPPRSAVNLVQGYVSYWRSVLDPDREHRASGARLTSTGGGYCLHVDLEESDLLRFRARARDGHDAMALGDLYAASRLLRSAITERRGPALGEFAQPALLDAAASFEAQWLATVESAADVELSLARPVAALSYVEPLVGAHPLRESLVALQMLALYRSGRQADALDVFDRARQALSDELGVAPGPRLRRVHLDVLHQSISSRGPRAGTRGSPLLPSRLSSFVGREQLRDQVHDLLDTRRVVNLVGPPGSGKTRLAVEVAAAVAATGGRSVTFVDLAPVRDSNLLWQAVTTALGRPAPPTTQPDDVLAALDVSAPVLLVLDNLEHLLEAVPGIEVVLGRAPLLSVLTTSRERLGVLGEQLVNVAPLGTPGPGDAPDEVLASPAVRLFVDRARDADPAFVVRDQDVAVVGGICRRLDGLPLAIELAAPLTSTLSLRALLDRLDRPVALLGGRPRGGDQQARHRTLRAALDWSHATLGPAQSRLFSQLSVFVSGARLEQVEEVSGLGAQTVSCLAELLERNLVYRSGVQDAPRYRQLVTIRDYAGERLATDPVRAVTLQRHTRTVCDLAERVARGARSIAGVALVEQLGGEQDEVRSVLARLDEAGEPGRRLELVVDCLPLWWDLGYIREGHDRLTRALAEAPPGTQQDLRAAGCIAAVFLADALGRTEAALELGAEASRSAQLSGSGLLQALSLCVQGNTRAWMGADAPDPAGIAIAERALGLALRERETTVRWGWASRSAVLVTTLLVLTDLLRYRDARRADAHVRSVLAECDPDTDAYTGSFALRAAGALDSDAGRWSSAEERLTASLALAARAASLRSRSRSAEELARLWWRRGDLRRAVAFCDSATGLALESGHVVNSVRCAGLASDIASALGDHARAGALLDQAEAAAGSHHRQVLLQMTGPRRARGARLTGRPDEADQHLRAAAELEHAGGLTPDRAVYLLEAAHAAHDGGDLQRAAGMVRTLRETLDSVGIGLAEPQRRQLDELTRDGRVFPGPLSLADQP